MIVWREAPVQKLWETLADLAVAQERTERRQDGIDVCFDIGEYTSLRFISLMNTDHSARGVRL